MKDTDHLVVVLDDEPSVLRGLERLLDSRGYAARLHGTPESLFECGLPQVPACLILDNNLSHAMTGIQVHEESSVSGGNCRPFF